MNNPVSLFYIQIPTTIDLVMILFKKLRREKKSPEPGTQMQGERKQLKQNASLPTPQS